MRRTLVRRLRRHEKVDVQRYLRSVSDLVRKVLDAHDKRTYHMPAFGYTLGTGMGGHRVVRCYGVDILLAKAGEIPQPVDLGFFESPEGSFLYVTEDGQELKLNQKTVDYITTCRDAVAQMAQTFTTREGNDE